MADRQDDGRARPTASSRQSYEGAGWRCKELGRYKRLLPVGGRPLSWVSLRPLLQARNDWLARLLSDPTNDQRRRWVAAQLDTGVSPEFTVERYSDRDNISFLVMGDTGEGDASQYCVVPGLLTEADDTAFLFVLSDVVYPAGDVNEYGDKFYRAYKDYIGSIYAIPGNHDWYDGLNGFMRHFCAARARRAPSFRDGLGAGSRRALRQLLWRKPAPANEDEITRMKQMRGRPEQQADQPGPYFALDAGPLLLVGIDTGIIGDLDRDQAQWLRRISRDSPKPKILLTGKPLYVDNLRKPSPIEDSDVTVEDIVTAPEHNYIATIGGDIHNYQRYPVTLGDGRTIQHFVAGGGGAGTQGTHKIPRVSLPGVDEDDFRCYPRRGDSLSRFSYIYQRRFRWLFGDVGIAPDQAAALMAERLGVTPTRPADRDVVITPEARRAFDKVFPRRERLKGPLHAYFVQFLDWNDPPMFKSFVRVDASPNEVVIRCFGATGCREHEQRPPIEDALRGAPDGDGRWRWDEITATSSPDPGGGGAR